MSAIWLNPFMSRPASRLLAFLELLQARPVVHAREAAAKLGVSERTIRRYSVSLHELGIPVDGQPGLGGGYRLRPGLRLPPLMLDDEEAAAIAFGLALAELRGLAGAEGALAKVRRVLPERLARRVERLRGEIAISGEPTAVAASGETLLVTAEAIRRHRSLQIGYTSHQGARSVRSIDPYGIVARQGRWYVPALDHASGELRTFRADRISSATISEPAAPAPAEFDPVAHVIRMLARFPWAWHVVVLVEATPAELAGRLPATLAELTADGTGTRVELRADSLEWVAGVLAGLGAGFEIVAPRELDDHVSALAARLEASVRRGERPGAMP